MPRNVGMVRTSIWVDEDFRALTEPAQRVYLLLISQPEINNAGVLGYSPKRWARYAPESTFETIEAAIEELEAARFVVVDRDSDELLVRTFVRYDRSESNPKLRRAAQQHYGGIESRKIQLALEAEFPHVFGAAALNGPVDNSPSKDLPDAASDSPSEDLSDSSTVDPRAHARPYPQPQPYKGRGRTEATPAAAHEAAPPGAELGQLPVAARCPVCGPLHSVPRGFDMVDHVANVHGYDEDEARELVAMGS